MRKGWVWVLGLGVLAGGGLLWWRTAPLTLTVVTPTRGPAVEAIYATGTVEPTVMMPIAPRTGARLAELAPFTAEYPCPAAGARYYLCREGACAAPAERLSTPMSRSSRAPSATTAPAESRSTKSRSIRGG